MTATMTAQKNILLAGLLGALTGCAHPPSTPAPVQRILNVSLQAILDSARAAGQKSVIFPSGQFVLQRGLVIDGADGLTVTIPAGTEILVDDVNADVLAIRNSKNVTISGGSFAHLKPLTTYQCHGSALKLEKSSEIVVRHATLRGCGAIGVDAHEIAGLTVESCAVLNNTFNAFYLDHCSKVRIWDSVIENNANAFQAYGLDDLEMSGNLIRNNGGYWRTPATTPGP